jgi:hypothetical protein
MPSNIIFSKLRPYANEIIGHYQCWFRNRTIAYQVFFFAVVRYLNKAYGSVRREVLYNILVEFGVPTKLVKIWLKKMYSNLRIGKHLSDKFPIERSQK